jgi:hypothetical protein
MFLPGSFTPMRVSMAPPFDPMVGAGITGAYSVSRKVVTGYSANSGAFYHLTSGLVDTLYNQAATGSTNNFTEPTAGERCPLANQGPRNQICLNFNGSRVYLLNAISQVFSAAAGYFIASVIVSSIAGAAQDFNAPCIMGDSGGYLGLYLDGAGSLKSLHGLNSDATAAEFTPLLSFGSFGIPFIAEWWHSNGQVGCSVNGNDAVTNSTNTSNMTFAAYLGYGFNIGMVGFIFEAMYANAMPTAAQRAYMRQNLLSWVT